MNIQTLLGNLPVLSVTGAVDKEITLLTADSRQAGEGAMFVAVRGVTVDGHSFIPSLRGKGVAAMVVDTMPDNPEEYPGTTFIVVENTSVALGHLASHWYGEPSKKLRLVGVTGTNGKTTTATLIYEMARLCGYKAGLLSTVVNYIDTEAVHATQTTPRRPDHQRAACPHGGEGVHLCRNGGQLARRTSAPHCRTDFSQGACSPTSHAIIWIITKPCRPICRPRNRSSTASHPKHSRSPTPTTATAR